MGSAKDEAVKVMAEALADVLDLAPERGLGVRLGPLEPFWLRSLVREFVIAYLREVRKGGLQLFDEPPGRPKWVGRVKWARPGPREGARAFASYVARELLKKWSEVETKYDFAKRVLAQVEGLKAYLLEAASAPPSSRPEGLALRRVWEGLKPLGKEGVEEGWGLGKSPEAYLFEIFVFASFAKLLGKRVRVTFSGREAKGRVAVGEVEVALNERFSYGCFELKPDIVVKLGERRAVIECKFWEGGKGALSRALQQLSAYSLALGAEPYAAIVDLKGELEGCERVTVGGLEVKVLRFDVERLKNWPHLLPDLSDEIAVRG